MAYPYKRGKRWYIGYRDEHGKDRREPSAARSKTEAMKLAQEEEAKAERIRRGLEKPRAEDPLFSKFADDFDALAVPKLASAKTVLGRTKRMRALFEGKRLSQISIADVAAMTTEMLADGYAPQTAEHFRRTLRRMFNLAIKWGRHAGANPAADEESRVKIPETSPKFLELAELSELLAVVPEEWQALVRTAVLTGLRKGELLGLQKRNVHLDRRLIEAERSYQRATTKGGKARPVAIPEELLPCLLVQLRTAPGEYLFPRPDGKPWDSNLKLHEMVVGWLAAAGIKSTIRFKDLRSTFATHAAEQVEDLRFVQRTLGHHDLNLTDRRYAAMRQRQLIAGAAKLDFGTAGVVLSPSKTTVVSHNCLTAGAGEGFALETYEQISQQSPTVTSSRDEGIEPTTFGSGGNCVTPTGISQRRLQSENRPFAEAPVNLCLPAAAAVSHNCLTPPEPNVGIDAAQRRDRCRPTPRLADVCPLLTDINRVTEWAYLDVGGAP